MDKASLDKVLGSVEKVLKENFILQPPVKIDEVAKNYGLEIKEIEFDGEFSNVSGFIDSKSNTIYVNAADSDNRQAFTIAHELGHWLLHKEKLSEDKYAILYRTPIGVNGDPVEKEANTFAANLLVPKQFLDDYRTEIDNKEFETIAKIFGVSTEVIGYRVRDEYGRNSEQAD